MYNVHIFFKECIIFGGVTILCKHDLPQLDYAAQFVPCELLLFPNPQSLHTVPLDTTKQQQTVCEGIYVTTGNVLLNSQKQSCGSLGMDSKLHQSIS